MTPFEELAEAEAGVPEDVKRELLDCAAANGSISYHYLLRLYKRGGTAVEAQYAALQQENSALLDSWADCRAKLTAEREARQALQAALRKLSAQWRTDAMAAAADGDKGESRCYRGCAELLDAALAASEGAQK